MLNKLQYEIKVIYTILSISNRENESHAKDSLTFNFTGSALLKITSY